MSSQTLGLSQEVEAYIRTVTVNESDVLKALREETSKLEAARMQISPEQGQFMALMANLVQAKNVLEIGVFTGYSTICVAKELVDDGKLIACDVSEEWTSIAKKYWQKCNVDNKIDLRIKPALETLNELLDQGRAGSFDMAFIDADKTSYIDYYNCCLDLLRTGGVILIDNTLWSGAIADDSDQTDDTVALRELNALVAKDTRVKSSLLTIGDGLTVIYKL